MQIEEQTVDFNFDISEIPVSAFEPHPLSYYQHNRTRLQENLKKHVGDNYKPGSIAIFKGHHEHYNNHDDDATSDFSPERNFYYLFGFEGQWDCYAVFNLCTGEAVVALKKKSEIGQIFEGGLTVKDDPKAYGVDKFIWVDDLRSYVESLNAPEIYVMKGQVRDDMSHYASFDWLDSHPKLNTRVLYQVICYQRSIKSDYEISLIKRVSKISSEAHKFVMRKARPGMTEFHCRELFKLYCGLNGATHEAYGSICGSSMNAATLHYIVDDRVTQDGDLILNDMGARGAGYLADITCTFPVNGKFTEKQKDIYNIVLKAVRDCEAMLKPGTHMKSVYEKSCSSLSEGLIKIGLLKCDLETALKHRLYRTFYPHGLAHYLGLYVHDVGKCKLDEDKDYPNSQSITTQNLEPRMNHTNEPGIYFIEPLIEKAQNNEETKQYYDFEKIEAYKHVGGVRIEDNVLITEDGCDRYTDVPRTVEEIEAWMAQK